MERRQAAVSDDYQHQASHNQGALRQQSRGDQPEGRPSRAIKCGTGSCEVIPIATNGVSMLNPSFCRKFMNGTTLLCMLLLTLAGAGTARAADEGPRQRTNINAFWKYQQGDFPGAEAPAFTDT